MKEIARAEIKTISGKALIEFYSEVCGVCAAVRRKLELLEDGFRDWEFLMVNTSTNPLVAGEYSVFAVPTVLVMLEGRELRRWSRNFSIAEIREYMIRIDSLEP